MAGHPLRNPHVRGNAGTPAVAILTLAVYGRECRPIWCGERCGEECFYEAGLSCVTSSVNHFSRINRWLGVMSVNASPMPNLRSS
jgi:hypothetical protein